MHSAGARCTRAPLGSGPAAVHPRDPRLKLSTQSTRPRRFCASKRAPADDEGGDPVRDMTSKPVVEKTSACSIILSYDEPTPIAGNIPGHMSGISLPRVAFKANGNHAKTDGV